MESKSRMNELSEKHLQTLKKQNGRCKCHRSQTAIGHRQPLTRT